MQEKESKVLNEYLIDAIIAILLLMFAFFINYKIRISGLYMDDLYMWSCYDELSFKNFVFPTDSTRFRPVYWIVAWLELGLIKSRIFTIVPINIVFASAIAIIIYLFSKKLSNSRVVAAGVSVYFLMSRFSYYNIAQLLGLMEAMALLFFIAQIYYIYKYFILDDRNGFYQALFFYLLTTLTHERFMVLIPIFYIVLIFLRNKEIEKYLAPVLTFIMIQFARFLMIGTILPAGTGGTNVTETFNIKIFIYSLFSEFLYLLGINKGPEHLNGIMWSDYPLIFKLIAFISIFLCAVIFIYYLYVLFLKYKNGMYIYKNICFTFILIAYMLASVVSSSVTIRVEMRWLYAPLAACLILLSYMVGVSKDIQKLNNENYYEGIKTYFNLYFYIGLSILLLISLSFSDMLTRFNYDKIYLFPKQRMHNSLADLTVGKYKDEIFGSDVYVVGKKYAMSEYDSREFFKVYNKYNDKDNIYIYYVDSIYELPKLKQGDVVLKEEADYNSYTDITSVIKDMQIEIIKGYYEADGWMDKEAELNIFTGKEGNVKFKFLYSAPVGEGKVVTIRYEDKIIEHAIQTNQSEIELKFEPYRRINFKFKNNFINEDIEDSRNGERLSILVDIDVE